MHINFEYYHVFCQVARCRSMTLAAQALSISQPAVSKSIAQLERQLGCALFIRAKNGVSLTAEGQELFRYVSHANDLILRGENRVHDMLRLDSGELCIATSDLLLRIFLLPHLRRFHQQYPHVKVRLIGVNTPTAAKALRAGHADVAVVAEGPDLKNFTHIPVLTIHDIFIAGRPYRALRDRILSLEEIVRLPLICAEEGSITRQFLDSFFTSRGFSLQPEFELSSSDLIVPFVENGLGVGIVMSDLANQSLRQGRVFEVRVNEHLPSRQICAATLPDGNRSQAVQCFLDNIVASAEPDQNFP